MKRLSGELLQLFGVFVMHGVLYWSQHAGAELPAPSITCHSAGSMCMHVPFLDLAKSAMRSACLQQGNHSPQARNSRIIFIIVHAAAS